MTRKLQNGPQKPPKWRPKPSKIEPKLGQEGSRTTKKSKNNIDPTKRGGARQGPPFLEENVANMAPTWVPRWSQNGEKIDAKIDQNLMPLGIGFVRILVDFGRENEAKLAPKWDPKSIEFWMPLKIDF